MLGLILERENLLIFLLLQEAGLVIDEGLVLVDLGLDLLPAMKLVEAWRDCLLRGACILLLSLLNLLVLKSGSHFRETKVLLEGHAPVVKTIGLANFFLRRFVDTGVAWRVFISKLVVGY